MGSKSSVSVRAQYKYDNFDYAVSFLYDDANLQQNLEGAIGTILKDDREAAAISHVIAAIEVVFARWGTSATDEEYINYPEWAGVLNAASEAIQILKDDKSENE